MRRPPIQGMPTYRTSRCQARTRQSTTDQLMSNPATSLLLMALTALSLMAAYLACYRLRHLAEAGPAAVQHGLVASIGGLAGGLYLYRWLGLHGRWQPLTSHLDGLLLMATLLAAATLFFQLRKRLQGLAAFGLPVLTLVLAWAICAAAWTDRPFRLQSLAPVWQTVHLAGVYLGTASAAIAAGAGAMFLYVQRRLKRKADLQGIGKMASLESLETLIVRAATLGFALLTLGLLAGLVILSEISRNGTVWALEWWYSPKIALAIAAWGVYALLMNVRHASRFRGARAAWLSIAGLVLLLVTYGLVTALSTPRHERAVGHWRLALGPSAAVDRQWPIADCRLANDRGATGLIAHPLPTDNSERFIADGRIPTADRLQRFDFRLPTSDFRHPPSTIHHRPSPWEVGRCAS